jgi:RNA polymerase sigma-70 factor (ECF subfamily)
LTDELIIIKKVIAGDSNAFAALVDRYKDLAITLAYNILLNKEDAEDIVQDAFIKSYSSLSTFKGDSRFSTWFYRIVMNTALNKRKVKKLDTVIIENQLPEEETLNINIDLSNFHNHQQRKYIQNALQRLSEGERICITMYYLNELSLEEIKDLTGYSSSNIKVLLFRGRKHLYNQLESLLKEELKDLI